jgi:prepilin-type N-terminal cleavage/methylation domain-containing protein
MHRRNSSTQAGFTLVEVLIASALLIAVSAGVGHLIGVATVRGRDARTQTCTTLLAAARMEQLRALAWGYEPGFKSGKVPRSDTATDLSTLLPTQSGPGLTVSPAGTLSDNVPPYVDYLGERGQWVGAGASPPPHAVFIRRWSIRPLPDDPARTLILSVLVTTVAQDAGRTAPWSARSQDETLLVVVRTREGT